MHAENVCIAADIVSELLDHNFILSISVLLLALSVGARSSLVYMECTSETVAVKLSSTFCYLRICTAWDSFQSWTHKNVF